MLPLFTVTEMCDRITPLAAVTAAPFVPLLLTIWSPEDLIMRIVQVVF